MTQQGTNIWFTADTHFRHKNIIKHCPERQQAGGFEADDMDSHDKWVMDIWNNTVSKNDTVYIIGDFSFATTEWTKKLCGKLNGRKILILGNHDGSSDHLEGYFKEIKQMKLQTFKKSVFPFLEEDFQVFMCHYPMVTWNAKHFGSVNVHGHCHGRLNGFNQESTDLRVDVGFDSDAINKFGLVSLEELYLYFKKKTGGEKFTRYASDKKNEKEMVV